MSHFVETMAYAGKRPVWHGLGTPMSEIDGLDLDTVRHKAGLNWKLGLAPLVIPDDSDQLDDNGALDCQELGLTHHTSDHKVVYRKSDGRVFATVGPSYVPLQNDELLGFFEPFIESKMLSIESAGSLKDGEITWCLGKLLTPSGGQSNMYVGSDEITKYLLLTNDNTGKLAVRVGITPVRVVCWNTLSSAIGGSKSNLIKLLHTESLHVNLDVVSSYLQLVHAQFTITQNAYNRLYENAFADDGQLDSYFKTCLNQSTDVDTETSTSGTKRLLDVYHHYYRELERANSKGMERNLWLAYQGFNGYLNHSPLAAKSDDSRVRKLWLSDTDSRAFNLALSLCV